MLTRLARVKPFALSEAMVPAAAISTQAQIAIERYLIAGRRELRSRLLSYLQWMQGPEGRAASPEEAQRRFTFLRLRFNTVLSQFDLFSDVITQRSEHDTGVWLSGLDAVAADALHLPGGYFESPPLICYLDRGSGAAIRRARTRLARWRRKSGGDCARAARAHGRQRHRFLADPRGRPSRCGFARSGRIDTPSAQRPASQCRQRTHRLAFVGALDLGNSLRFLVGRQSRDCLHAGTHRCRQSCRAFSYFD